MNRAGEDCDAVRPEATDGLYDREGEVEEESDFEITVAVVGVLVVGHGEMVIETSESSHFI